MTRLRVFVAGTHKDHFSYASHASQIELYYGQITKVSMNSIHNTNYTNIIHMKIDITAEQGKSCMCGSTYMHINIGVIAQMSQRMAQFMQS